MKIAKILSLVCLINVFYCLLLPCTAKASTKYVRVVDDQVPLYTNAETKKITCWLEKSYYLAVLEELDEFYKVELLGNNKLFPKIVGFVKKSSVQLQSQQPSSPLYPTALVKVQNSSANVYFSPLDSSQVLLVATNTQQMSYYGRFVDDYDVCWYYVYFNGYFGYVKQVDVTNVQIELHPTPLPQPVEPSKPTNTPSQTPDVNPTEPTTASNEILLIAFAGILATALTCALFLPKQNERGTSYYNENR